MSESILPVSPEPILATESNSDPSISQMGPLSPVDKCGLQRDALRGIMMELKRNVKTLQERQDAFHRCMIGRSLKDTQPEETGYRDAVNLMGGAAMMTMGLDQIAFATGITIE